MKLGDWEVISCLAGTFRLDGGAMFGVVPKLLWSRLIPADEDNRIPMALRTFIIKGHGKTVLVDSGGGGGYKNKVRQIYQFEDDGGLNGALKSCGVAPAEITDIIVTHLHFDHAGGLATLGEGGWTLTFPDAVHHVQMAQWEHANAPTARDQASYFKERLDVLRQGDTLALHEGDWSLAPGVDIITVHGHTPGQQLPRVKGDGTTVLYCADLIPTSAHIPIPYVMSYDLNPVVTMEEKEQILTQAVEEKWILFFEHDPDIEACYVKQENSRFMAGDPVKF
jgi:glyoxylase-like metal-dependent hydrolase (beta-lactamase superfamily II)